MAALTTQATTVITFMTVTTVMSTTAAATVAPYFSATMVAL